MSIQEHKTIYSYLYIVFFDVILICFKILKNVLPYVNHDDIIKFDILFSSYIRKVTKVFKNTKKNANGEHK